MLQAMMQNMAAAALPDEFPRLNPHLDPAALAAEFRRRGRMQIRNILTQASADRIHSCLRHETPYGLCLNTGGASRGLANLTPQQEQDYTQKAWREVGVDGFQFLFEQHNLSLEGEPYSDANHYWAKVVDFLNGPEFLDFARAVTGFADIEFADAQATLYRGGHFLTAHDDDTPGTKRRAAYVLSFASAWRPEWGGLLEFLDDKGRIEEGYMPQFNSLKLFRVPMTHYVSIVAPYAMVGRYSITGWLRGR
jgi:Rps23 Pro-64 3,4-dihydroxylase Tpa1-like proline 4-hydroxylase